MGVPISIDIPGAASAELFELAFARLRQIDDTFSTYKPGSTLNRFLRGERKLSGEMLKVKDTCEAYEQMTEGYFSAYFQGFFNPTGYVKGWAVQEAGAILQANGIQSFLINAAGDIMAASDGKKQWYISLQDPFLPTRTIGTIALKNGAIATSGTYERGLHIINPHTKKPTNELISASVYGKGIAAADVFATACIAMGSSRAIDFIGSQLGYEALLVGTDGAVFDSRASKAS